MVKVADYCLESGEKWDWVDKVNECRKEVGG